MVVFCFCGVVFFSSSSCDHHFLSQKNQRIIIRSLELLLGSWGMKITILWEYSTAYFHPVMDKDFPKPACKVLHMELFALHLSPTC